MKSNFDKSLRLVLAHEGGYVDHPRDPGGATNLGITFAVLQKWRGKAITKADVKALTRDEAGAIYRAKYWDIVRGDDLPSGLDYAVFDFAVNSGPSRAAIYLQEIVGVAPDGKIGPLTVGAAKAADTRKTIDALCSKRMTFLKKLSTFATFGRGWTSRVAGVRTAALAMVGSAPAAPKQQTSTPSRSLFDIIAAILSAVFKR